MENDIKKYGREWIILEKITKGNKEEIEEIKKLLTEEINWGELMEQAMSHKILRLFQFFL